MSRPVHLKVWCGDALVDTQTLTRDVIKIGRLESSHLCLDSDSVARMHAVIEVGRSELRVVDLGSAGGTLLNGARVEKTAVLRSGDALALGEYRVELEVSDAPASALARAPQAAVAQPMPGPTAQAQRPRVPVAAADVEQTDASPVAEVMAVYGRTVLDVQHVGQARRRGRNARAYFALGGVLLVAGGAFFASETVLRTSEWAAYETAKAEAVRVGRPAPSQPGTGFGGLGVALAFLGLVPMGIGAVRMRDGEGTEYTIGEGESASFSAPATSLPNADAFALVRDRGDGDTALQFTSSMEGDVTVEGRRYSLEELVTSGQATANGAAFAFPLRAGARCKVQHQGLLFHVNSVPPGKVVAGRSEADKPFWLYNAASVIAIGSVLALAHLAMPDEGSLELDEQTASNRFVGYISQPDEADDDEPDDDVVADDVADEPEGGDPGTRARGHEGKMGNPEKKPSEKNHLYSMKGPRDVVPRFDRSWSPDVSARNAGILGMIAQDSGHFLASPDGTFAQGNDEADVWGGLSGTEVGESFGTGGLGLIGAGRGGGGEGKGVLGLGHVGLIGTRGNGGNAVGYSHGKGSGFKTRKRTGPVVRAAKSTVRGALDRDIVRRVVRAHINEVRHCYNQGLVKDPTLRGRVAVQFTIGATGRVPVAVVSESSLGDRNVGNCVSKAVRRWKFPKPEGGGNVVVTYPFVLNPG